MEQRDDGGECRCSLVGKRVIEQVERAVVGKRRLLEQILTAVLAGGHVLLEDYPGLAKTLTALSFAEALGLDFKRIQFTPDLLPSDITGSVIYDRAQGEFELRKGPIFANIVLADEINRASPKTQSALLEAMQEGQVTLEGETWRCPAVHCDRHPKPDRVRGHLSPARSPARSLFDQAGDRLPQHGRGAGDFAPPP